MFKIGLTGGIGSGKSTVAKQFLEKGLPIIDADVIAREILELHPEVKKNIKSKFGASFFDEKDSLNRRKLGNFIFNNSEARLKLEDLTMPYIFKEIFLKIDKYNREGAKLCIIDAPTLIESGLYKSMDFNILVWVDLDTQIHRVISRDNLSLEQVKSRINSQMPLEDKKAYVDFLINNNESLKNTKEQLERILSQIYNFEVEK